MAKNKKPLLQEGTVRRMMKLANMDALGDGFISEKYGSVKEGYGTGTGRTVAGLEDEPETASSPSPGYRPKAYGEKHGGTTGLAEQEDELEVGAEEEVEDVGGEEEIDMELGAEEAPEDEGLEGEITITDEEAQDIIDLAAKLEDAVGGEDEIEAGSEEEIEGFGGEEFDMELGGEEEEPLQEGLYEAALQGLNIDLVDDQAQRRRAVVREVKKRIYERVVNRLINESQKPQQRKPKRRRKR